MGLEPDPVTLGKGTAGGIAIGTLGRRRELGDAITHAGVDLENGGSVGGTLAANALSLAAARTGAESARAAEEELDEYLHLAVLNRGFLQTPFHNMALIGPTTTAQDVSALVSAIGAAVDDLLVVA